jgi:Bacteriophage tail assembly protein
LKGRRAGGKKILWDNKGRRNEALDCFVYALAALRIGISRFQLNLQALSDGYEMENKTAGIESLADLARKLGGDDGNDGPAN